METPLLSDNGKKLCEFFVQKAMLGDFTNNDLLHFIELSGAFLNLKTIPKYKEDKSMSYNGVKNHREIKELFDVKFVVDND